MKQTAKDFFIPHEGNNYQPDSLQRISLGVMSILVLFSFAVANIQSLLWIGSDWLVSTVLPAVIVELTNEERTGGALGTLRRNSVLDAAAQKKAEHMAEHEYFSHYSPDGVSPWYWFDEVAYSFVHAGENLAVHFSESDEVVDAWMNSPGHRANILNDNYLEIGVGTAKGSYKGFPTVFVVQLFGAPAARAAESVAVDTTASIESTKTELEALPLETTPQPSLVLNDTTEATTEVAGVDIVEMAVVEEIALAVPVEEEKESSHVEIEESEESALAVAEEEYLLSEKNEKKEVYVPENPPHEVVVVYSDLATTSRAGVPLTTNEIDRNTHATSGATPATAGLLERGVTQSSSWLQLVYIMLAIFVSAALLLSIVIEWRRQHPVQIAYGAGLLAVMAFLFYAHTVLVSGVVIA